MRDGCLLYSYIRTCSTDSGRVLYSTTNGFYMLDSRLAYGVNRTKGWSLGTWTAIIYSLSP
ncbi:hypothetical protein RSAG8_01080, partial [Rhizoctonia solani AG-8 WAC10335]